MRITLYQPEIPQNSGTILRLAACMNVPVDIIQPCGFVVSDRQLRRSGMDYIDRVDKTFHDSWEEYQEFQQEGRLVLFDTKAKTPYTEFQFLSTDRLMVGRESDGVPDDVYSQTDEQVLIPMHPSLRSLNVAVSLSMVLGEALRQTESFYGGV